jgi:hypothetical protein
MGRYVPETRLFTLEELHTVFSKEMKEIRRNGWREFRWFLSFRDGNARGPRPELVPLTREGHGPPTELREFQPIIIVPNPANTAN